jgi:hypothetical protein
MGFSYDAGWHARQAGSSALTSSRMQVQPAVISGERHSRPRGQLALPLLVLTSEEFVSRVQPAAPTMRCLVTMSLVAVVRRCLISLLPAKRWNVLMQDRACGASGPTRNDSGCVT